MGQTILNCPIYFFFNKMRPCSVFSHSADYDVLRNQNQDQIINIETVPKQYAALTLTSWHTPSSQWGFRGKLLFLENEAEKNARCPGRRCILAWVSERGRKFNVNVNYWNWVYLFIQYWGFLNMYLPLVGLRAVGPVLLNVHTEEADVCSVNVLKCKKGFCPVGERLRHLSVVHKPGDKKHKLKLTNLCELNN